VHFPQCLQVLGQDQNTGSLFVQTVHELKIAGAAESKLFYDTDPLAGAAMNGDSGGLIEDQEILILKESVGLKTRFPGGSR